MRNKYIFGGVIVAVFLTLMIYLFSQSNIQYENNFRNVMSKDKTVKAAGSWVREKSYDLNRENGIFSFYMVDQNGIEMKVVYEGMIPNNFESAQSIVVTGKYSGGYFHAREILTKCPSKYQEQEVKSSGV